MAFTFELVGAGACPYSPLSPLNATLRGLVSPDRHIHVVRSTPVQAQPQPPLSLEELSYHGHNHEAAQCAAAQCAVGAAATSTAATLLSLSDICTPTDDINDMSWPGNGVSTDCTDAFVACYTAALAVDGVSGNGGDGGGAGSGSGPLVGAGYEGYERGGNDFTSRAQTCGAFTCILQAPPSLMSEPGLPEVSRIGKVYLYTIDESDVS